MSNLITMVRPLQTTKQRMAKANETTKNASQRAKDYGKQIATNAKTLTDFKKRK